jgi:hypothetical protein
LTRAAIRGVTVRRTPPKSATAPDFFNGGVRLVNKWEALVEVIRAFDPKQNPKTALCALLIVVGVPSTLAIGGALLLR